MSDDISGYFKGAGTSGPKYLFYEIWFILITESLAVFQKGTDIDIIMILIV